MTNFDMKEDIVRYSLNKFEIKGFVITGDTTIDLLAGRIA
jgi:hypothetical protein